MSVNCMRLVVVFALANLFCVGGVLGIDTALGADTARGNEPSAATAALIADVLAVQSEGVGNEQAQAAWLRLSRVEVDELPHLLLAIDDANPLAANYLRSALDAVVARAVRQDESITTEMFEQFVSDRDHAPRARRLAYEWLVRLDPSTPQRLLPMMLDDPSVELRRDAVARVMTRAAALVSADDDVEATLAYRVALSGAIDRDQVDQIAESLTKLGTPVDLARHFGFIQRWKLIGAFDNVGGVGFAAVYPPEKEIDFAAQYEGKDGEVSWSDHASEETYGNVDLYQAIKRENGTVAYGATLFDSRQPRDVDIRFGTVNATKIWLNGELLDANEVYHANDEMDQYIVRGHMNQGENTILIKVCQNEQEESWAQIWKFQLRVCDKAGTAILSANRPDAGEVARATLFRPVREFRLVGE
jgi:hypothetical protein